MTGFLQRLVDGAADVPPLAMPVPRSSSPIFSHDQRLGVRGLEMFGGLDHDPFEPVFEAPAMQAPRQPERTAAPPVRPPAPAADRAPPRAATQRVRAAAGRVALLAPGGPFVRPARPDRGARSRAGSGSAGSSRKQPPSRRQTLDP
jgi:hypothetical protein